MGIGTRLREERLMLGMSQSDFGQAGGVAKNAQSNYESDKRSPDADYLAKISRLGVDVGYVITGKRFSQPELMLLTLFNKLTGEQQAAVEGLLQIMIKD